MCVCISLQCGAAITDLLSHAADAMQQPAWSTNGLSPQRQQDFLVNFCTAVKVRKQQQQLR